MQLEEVALIALGVHDTDAKFPLPFDANATVPVGGNGPLLAVSVTVELQLAGLPTLSGEGLQRTLVVVGSGGTPTKRTCIV